MESFSQVCKTPDNKVAEFLNRIPVNHSQISDELMNEMMLFGEPGIRLICDQIVPSGKGDDSRPRFAAQNYTRFVSREEHEKEKLIWEKICIIYTAGNNDVGVKYFFMSQLQIIGGKDALALVLKEFENGYPEIREICFRTLINWNDYNASYALYDICSSGNKTFEAPAFNGYIDHVMSSILPDEQKLLLYRKIMPFALTPQRKIRIINEIGRLKIYQALFYIDNFLNDTITLSAASNAAINIALPSGNARQGLSGEKVKEILLKAIERQDGGEMDNDKALINKYLIEMAAGVGFKPLFNGRDLAGWQGLVENPIARAKMRPAELAQKQVEADRKVAGNWSVKDGCIWFNGSGNNLCSVKEYGNFELLVDWKISKAGDSGIYLRGSPQVQIWDTSRIEVGAQVGSGGLYNNLIHPSKPLCVADNPVGDWNTFRIVMIGEKVSVWLNGVIVTDNVTMENYWDRKIPIFPTGTIELQAHGTDLAFRDLYIKEINAK
jgi:hypothetical protein